MKLIAKLLGIRSKPEQIEQVYLSDKLWVDIPTAIEIIGTSNSTNDLTTWMTHYSGYVREASIKRCLELGNADFVPIIAERLRDWVPQVRNAARTAMISLLDVLPATSFVSLLAMIRSLNNTSRTDHKAWLSEFEKKLVSRGGREDVLKALTSDDIRLRRAAFELCGSLQLLPIKEMISIGLQSDDIVNADVSLKFLIQLAPQEQFEFIKLGTHSCFAPVRLAAFRLAALRPFNSEIEEMAKNALLDGQGRLRQIAVTCLSDAGIDVEGYALEKLCDPQTPVKKIKACLSLVFELKGTNARTILEQYCDAESSEIREHTYKLIVKLSPDRKDELVLAALQDRSRRVRKIGAWMCIKLGAYVPFDAMKTLIDDHSDYSTAFRIASLEKWNYLCCIAYLEGQLSTSGVNVSYLTDLVKDWMRLEGKSFTKPTQWQRNLLTQSNLKELAELTGNRKSMFIDRMLEVGIWSLPQ